MLRPGRLPLQRPLEFFRQSGILLVLAVAYLLVVASWLITLHEPRIVSRGVADLLNLLVGAVLATVVVAQLSQIRRAEAELRQERRRRQGLRVWVRQPPPVRAGRLPVS